ncbi:MAG: alpha/beta hydrolase [Acidimicrobiia bacterium]
MDRVVLDPEVAAALDAMPPMRFNAETVPAIRANRAAMLTFELGDAVERTDHVVRAAPELVVRVHRPRGVTTPLPCVYSIHGGGYVIGTCLQDDPRFDVWSAGIPCIGASVEYRLAPETPYPGPLDDCYDGLRWIHEHHEELGIDPDRIGIAGLSAGGGLAAALALLARDRAEIPLAFQLLECPMLDDRQQTSSSRRDGLPVWSRESNEFGWRSYLGDLYGSDDVPELAAPARARDLTNLPPTLLIVGGADGFRDEDIEYALRLSQSGVATELHVLPGVPHGVQLAVGSSAAKRWRALVDDWVRGQLAG